MATITGLQIPLFRLMIFRRALIFEIEHGTKIRLFRGPLASSRLRKEFGWKTRNKIVLLYMLDEEILKAEEAALAEKEAAA